MFENAKQALKVAQIKAAMPKNLHQSDALVLTGLPRSGTTWLAEILNTVPSSGIIFEPLHIENVPEAAYAGFEWATDLDVDAYDPLKVEFMERLLAGKLMNRWLARDLKLRQVLGMRHLIIKFVRAENILAWLHRHFDIRLPIFIIRHPCAQIASLSKRFWGTYSTREAVMGEPALKRFPFLREVAERARTPEECLAAKWCLANFKALSEPQYSNLVVYEELVSQGEEALIRLFKEINLPLPGREIERLNIASITSHDGNPLQNKRPLENWYTSFSRNEIKNITRIVEQFGMDFYLDAPEPDYERLRSGGPVNFKR